MVKGTTNGTISDLDGKFVLSAKAEDILVFTFIGYKVKEVPVGQSTDLKVTMDIETSDLEEVVVVGYGVKKKSLVTGAISSVEADDVVNSAVRAEQALQGKAAGVTLVPQSGSPGNGIKVRIRGAGSNGNSDPLYIVDGMKTGDINFLNPNDIESMEVLKDAASSAIYGTEGANGVVIITTKGGKSGKSNIDYSFQYGIQSLPKSLETMDAHQYATFMREIHDPAVFTNVPDPANYAPGTGTNWFEEASENAMMQRHNIAFSGGNEKSTYMVSAGYSEQDGIIGGDQASFERLSTRINGTHKVKDWVEVGVNFSYTNSKRSSITEDDGFNGIVNSMIMMDPTGKARYDGDELTPYMRQKYSEGVALVRDDAGMFYGISDNDWLQGEIVNPLIRLATEKGITKDDKILSSGYIKLKPIEGLSITSRAGLDLAYQNYNGYTPAHWANSRFTGGAPTININDQKWHTWLWENFASYTKKFGDHNVTGLLGMSAQEHTWEGLFTRAGQMLKEDDQFRYPDYVTTRDNDRVTGGKSATRMASYFGRLSYDFKNRYMFEATVRRDGSSLFGTDYKWGSFPSVSAGWVMSNESFWSLEALSYAKVRASWGQNGSVSNLGVNQYRALITSTGITYPDGEGTLLAGAEPALLANSELRWETSEQTNIGLDLRALDGMISFTADWYKKVTKDLLTTAQPPLSHGNNAPFGNAGEVTNSGFEFSLGIKDKVDELTYSVNLNASILKNEVTHVNALVDRIGGAGLPTLGTLTYFEKGEPVWYYRGYKTNGIDQATGDVIVVDTNTDGEINEEDMVNIGDPHPNFSFGANINLGYKGFDFNIFMQGVTGVDNYVGFMRADNLATNRLVEFTENRWIEGADNSNATLPRASYNNERYFKSDMMVKDGSYFKIRQIQLGYTLPENIIKQAKLGKARVYFSLNDYFTFSSYPGMDPEVGSGNNAGQGIDFGIYPVSKKVLFGLNLTF
jgi:TonB-linked SusC/RagA family outer membrane protein